MKKLILLILVFTTITTYSQSKRRIIQMLKSYDIGKGYNAPSVQGGHTSINGVYTMDVSALVQGSITYDVAFKNRDSINFHLSNASSLNDSVFQFNTGFNAFIKTDTTDYNKVTATGLIVPSNIHIKMTDFDTISVLPNYNVAYTVFTGEAQTNVKISGGNLYGDRYTHDYTSIISTHEFGFAIYLRGAKNVVIENMNIQNMSGDCIIIQSTANRNDDGSEKVGESYATNWIIRNNILNKARRNNISLADIDTVLIYNNTISNGGDGGDWSSAEGYNSKGVLPRYNMDFEAITKRDINGNLQPTEMVRNVTVDGNTFTGAYNGDIDLYKCNDVEIFNNTFDSGIANLTAYNIQIHDNIFTSTKGFLVSTVGLNLRQTLEPNGAGDYNVNYQVYNNTITGYKNGINIGTTNSNVYNNTIINCETGVMLLNSENLSLYDNTITSNVLNSKGYYSSPIGIEVTNLNISRDTISVADYGLLFSKVNVLAIANQIVVDSCQFVGSNVAVEIRDTHFMTIKNSTYATYDDSKNGTSNIILINNKL